MASHPITRNARVIGTRFARPLPFHPANEDLFAGTPEMVARVILGELETMQVLASLRMACAFWICTL
jgi:hypothetical protein